MTRISRWMDGGGRTQSVGTVQRAWGIFGVDARCLRGVRGPGLRESGCKEGKSVIRLGENAFPRCSYSSSVLQQTRAGRATVCRWPAQPLNDAWVPNRVVPHAPLCRVS